MTTALLVEPDDAVVAAWKAALEGAGLCQRFMTAPDGEAAMEAVEKARPDLVVMSLEAQHAGVGLVGAIRATDSAAETPVLVVTGQDGLEVRLGALEAGASDVIQRAVDPRELTARARTHLRLKGVQDEMLKSAEKLVQAASRDALTGIMNQRRLMELAEVELRRSLRYGTPLGFMVINVDNFRALNDTHGRAEGDRVLKAVAEILQNSVRNTDFVARCSSDEFAVLLPMAEGPGTYIAAERVRNGVQVVVDVKGAPVTVSIGATHFPTCARPASVPELLDLSHQQLRDAQRAGRNRARMGPKPPP